MQFKGRKLLVVGGTSGIGLETARMVAEQGGSVVIVGNRAEKAEAARKGDDWDKLRVAHTLAGDGLESVARTVLVSLVVRCQATMEQLNQNPDIPPKQAVELLASLADSLSKAVSSSKKMLPETDRLATALEVVQRLGVFISKNKPALYIEFVDVLESFAGELENEFR